MAEIEHELKIRAPRARILHVLTDRLALEHWHRAKVSGNEREWRIEYPDATVFCWKVEYSGAIRFACPTARSRCHIQCRRANATAATVFATQISCGIGG
jgi:hypothetical protein